MQTNTQGIMSNDERAALLKSMYVADFNPLRFVDWLANLKNDAFWYFEAGHCIEPTYTVAQRQYIETVWREHYKGPAIEDAPSLFDYFYVRFVPMFFLHRKKPHLTGAVSGWGESGEGSTVEFNSLMDQVLHWTALHLPQLRVLHELGDAAYYDPTIDAVTVRKIVLRVENGSGITTWPLDEWVYGWLTQQIRYFVFKFCQREGLATGRGGVQAAPAKALAKAAENRAGLTM